VTPHDQVPGVVPQRCSLVLPSSGAFDSRAWRIASALAARGHDVTVLARLEPGVDAREDHPAGYRIIRVPVAATAGLPRPLRWLAGRLRGDRADGRPSRAAGSTSPMTARPPGRLRSATAAVVRLAAIALTVRSQGLATRQIAPPADLVHAMAYMGIPIGLALGRRDRAAVVYDARDIYVDAANVARLPGPARAIFARAERRWARRASRVMTVNLPYAEVMERRFGVSRPAIVMNCSYRRELSATRPRLIHDRLGLAPTTRVVLYQGGFSRERGIEQLIDALPVFPGDTVLVLLGYGSLQGELERRAALPDLAGRLFVLPAVPPADLLDWVGSADVVAMPIQPSTLNHRLTTPNKLFEAMAAGIPVVASDLPGMAGIVGETGCGLLCDPTDPAAIGAAIRAILDAPQSERVAYRERAIAAAHGPYSWETQVEILLAEYGRLTGRPW
jgi:glycosyltransferase involved in cell wall biosynthesis